MSRTPDGPAAPRPPSFGEVVRFSTPLMMGMLTTAVHSIVDTAFVGRLGTEPLAALGTAAIYYYTGFILFVGLVRNSIAFMARAWGEGRPERIGRLLGQYQGIALLALPLLLAGTQGFTGMTRLAGIGADVAALGEAYLWLRTWDILFALSLVLYASLYQSIGNSRFPMWVQWAVVGLNLGLDPLLIFGLAGFPALGVEGSALATLLAEALGAAFIVGATHASPLRRLCGLTWLPRPSWRLLREILAVGIPQGLGDFAEVLAWLGFYLIVGRLGDAALAANNVGIQVTQLLFLPGYALGIAAASYIGRFLGAGAPQIARRTVRRVLGLGIAYMAVLGVPLWFLGEPITAIFSADPAVIRLGGLVFKVMALYQAFDAMGMIARGALSGAGDTRYPTLALVACALAVFYPAAGWLSTVVAPGLLGAWLGALVYLVVLGVAMVARFEAGVWQHIRLGVEG